MTNKNKDSAKVGNGKVTVGNGNVTGDKSAGTGDKCVGTGYKDTATDDISIETNDKGTASDDISIETNDKSAATTDKSRTKMDKTSAKENKDYPLKDFYKKIYGRYDLVNRIFTFGQDRNWRKKAVEECLGNKPRQVLDICTGTGDLVLEMAEKAEQKRASTVENSANVAARGKDLTAKGPLEKDAIHLTGYDFSPEMLEEARKKAADAGQKIEFIEGNVAEMPFADNRFDTAGITFGIRNLIYENSNADRHLAEIHRVLRMNGRLVVLESSRPDSRIWRFVNGIYLQFILPWLGGLISGNLKAYRYLAKSSKNYYSRKEMAGILERAGFRVIRSRPLFLGSVMLLVAEKQEKA